MFFFKRKNVIKWDFNEDHTSFSKIKILVTEVQKFKETLFGIQNDPGSFSYVPDAIEVSGKISEDKSNLINGNNVTVLIPEAELNALQEGDMIALWLSGNKKCFKFEKI